MTESTIQQKIRLAIGKREDVRLFRNSQGVALTPDGRTVRYGLHPGSSDLIGFKMVQVTSDMIGQRLPVFCGIECKTATGRIRPEQQAWLSFCLSHNCLAGIARSPEEALKIIDPTY